MPVELWVASRWLHIIAAAFWIGGSLFLAAVLIPSVRRTMASLERIEIVDVVARRFSRLSWIGMAVLTGTGVVNLWTMQFSFDDFLTRRGATLIAKLVLFTVILVLSALHDFVYGPRAVNLARVKGTESVDYAAERRRASWIAMVNLSIGLAVLVLALMLRL